MSSRKALRDTRTFCSPIKRSKAARDTLLIQKNTPVVQELVTPNGVRMLGVRTARYGSDEGVAYTRIDADEPEILIVTDQWRMHDVSYDIVQKLVLTSMQFVETPEKIDQVFFAHVGSYTVQLTGRNIGSVFHK